MNLKTTCTRYTISGSTNDYSHDAAVAHALFLAMDQWGTDEFGVVDALRGRADEIMREWGLGKD